MYVTNWRGCIHDFCDYLLYSRVLIYCFSVMKGGRVSVTMFCVFPGILQVSIISSKLMNDFFLFLFHAITTADSSSLVSNLRNKDTPSEFFKFPYLFKNDT